MTPLFILPYPFNFELHLPYPSNFEPHLPYPLNFEPHLPYPLCFQPKPPFLSDNPILLFICFSLPIFHNTIMMIIHHHV